MKGYNSKKNDDFQNKRKRLPNNSKEIQVHKNKTQDEYAITKEDLLKKDYKKLPEEALSVVSHIIEKVPGLLAEQSIEHAATKSFNEAVNGSFRCVLDSGLHLAERKGQPNVFLGTGLDNTTNIITAQASWLKNESVLEIPVSPQIIAGVFNILSIVTAQHFMSQINKKLSNIDYRLNSIEQRLNDEDISVLWGNYTYLQDISNRIFFIQQAPDRIIAERDQISDITRSTAKSMFFFHKQIERMVESLDISDNKEVFNDKLQKLHFLQFCSVLSVRVYLYSRILYVLVNNVNDSNEIELILRDLEKQITTNYKYMSYAHNKEKEYISQTKFLNRISLKEQSEVVKFLLDNDLPYNTPFIPKNRKALLTKCDEFNNTLSEFSNEYRRITDDFRHTVLSSGEETELIYLNGEWFYKLIDSSNEKMNDDTDKSQKNNSR